MTGAGARFYEAIPGFRVDQVKVWRTAPSGATKYRVQGRSPRQSGWSSWYEITSTGFDYTDLREQNGTWRWRIQAGYSVGWSNSVEVSGLGSTASSAARSVRTGDDSGRSRPGQEYPIIPVP